MKCPKCGKLWIDGHMYCENCGYEIKLVPEFDANVEESITENIKGLLEENGSAEKETVNEKEPAQKENKKTRKKKTGKKYLFFTALAGLLAFVLAAAIYGGITVWNYSTIIHEMIAEYYLADADYDAAINYMEQVVQRVPDKLEHRFKLCELYIEAGRDEEALEAYKIVVGSSQFSIDEQIRAVEKLIDYYSMKKDYESIADYLETLQDETIRLAFLEYTSPSVTFSQPEGTYASMITLKLTAKGLGSIHYTTDGTVPDKNSSEFTETIFLEAGDNVVSAVFVNEFGVESPIVTKKYHIEYKKVSAPEVLTYSGTYNCPVKIEVSVEAGTSVYYTTDGSIPNTGSLRYTGALYAPLGKSVYKFIAVDSRGTVSEVVTRDYQVSLDTKMSIAEAQNILFTYAVTQGWLMYDEEHSIIFEYLYPMSVETGVDCYYFAGVARHIQTLEQFRTNTYYGVDVRTGTVYTFTN